MIKTVKKIDISCLKVKNSFYKQLKTGLKPLLSKLFF